MICVPLLTYSYRWNVDEELTFIHPSDVELYNAWDNRAFELQVANHELLGHGSGKLFEEDAEGKKNFDVEKVGYILGRATIGWNESVGGQPSYRWKNVSLLISMCPLIPDVFPSEVPRGINQAKRLVLSSGKCLHQWRNAVRKLLPCIVSPYWICQDAVLIILDPRVSGQQPWHPQNLQCQ